MALPFCMAVEVKRFRSDSIKIVSLVSRTLIRLSLYYRRKTSVPLFRHLLELRQDMRQEERAQGKTRESVA